MEENNEPADRRFLIGLLVGVVVLSILTLGGHAVVCIIALNALQEAKEAKQYWEIDSRNIKVAIRELELALANHNKGAGHGSKTDRDGEDSR